MGLFNNQDMSVNKACKRYLKKSKLKFKKSATPTLELTPETKDEQTTPLYKGNLVKSGRDLNQSLTEYNEPSRFNDKQPLRWLFTDFDSKHEVFLFFDTLKKVRILVRGNFKATSNRKIYSGILPIDLDVNTKPLRDTLTKVLERNEFPGTPTEQAKLPYDIQKYRQIFAFLMTTDIDFSTLGQEVGHMHWMELEKIGDILSNDATVTADRDLMDVIKEHYEAIKAVVDDYVETLPQPEFQENNSRQEEIDKASDADTYDPNLPVGLKRKAPEKPQINPWDNARFKRNWDNYLSASKFFRF